MIELKYAWLLHCVVALLCCACDSGIPPAHVFTCIGDVCPFGSKCEGNNVCVPDRLLVQWPLPPMPPGADNYEINADTVRDRTTGLLWQRGHSEALQLDTEGCPSECDYTWRLKAYCEDLSIDGGGWRLPTKIELVTLVDYTRFEPAIDPTAFPDTPSAYFYPTVSFIDGRTADRETGSSYDGFYVRCVKERQAPQAVEHYVITGQAIVDTMTRLRWTRGHRGGEINGGVTGTGVTLAESTAYCDALVFDGFSDWRVPNVVEMHSLLIPHEYYRLSWNTDQPEFLFAAEQGQNIAYFHTSTIYAPDRSKHWRADHGPRGVSPLPGADSVRCVRTEPAATDAGR